MGRSVSYATGAKVITFADHSGYRCEECVDGKVTHTAPVSGEAFDADLEDEDCEYCNGTGWIDFDQDDHDMLVDDMRDRLREMFPSVVEADDWIGREDRVIAENKLARFGLSEYCGLYSFWIVPKENGWYSDTQYVESFADRWIDSIADKFVAAFGELTKVGSMSNGEGVYRRIDR